MTYISEQYLSQVCYTFDINNNNLDISNYINKLIEYNKIDPNLNNNILEIYSIIKKEIYKRMHKNVIDFLKNKFKQKNKFNTYLFRTTHKNNIFNILTSASCINNAKYNIIKSLLDKFKIKDLTGNYCLSPELLLNKTCYLNYYEHELIDFWKKDVLNLQLSDNLLLELLNIEDSPLKKVPVGFSIIHSNLSIINESTIITSSLIT